MNTSGIQDWIVSNLVPLGLAILGVIILFRSRSGKWSETMNTTGIAIVGIIFIVGAAGFIAFGRDMSNVVFG